MNYEEIGRIAKQQAPGVYDDFTDEEVGRAYVSSHFAQTQQADPHLFLKTRSEHLHDQTNLVTEQATAPIMRAQHVLSALHSLSNSPKHLEQDEQLHEVTFENALATSKATTEQTVATAQAAVAEANLKVKLSAVAEQAGLTVEEYVRLTGHRQQTEIAFEDHVNREQVALAKTLEEKKLEVNAAILVKLVERLFHGGEEVKLSHEELSLLNNLASNLKVDLRGLLQNHNRQELQGSDPSTHIPGVSSEAPGTGQDQTPSS